MESTRLLLEVELHLSSVLKSKQKISRIALIFCFDFKTEDKCNSTSNNSGCIWRDNSCQQQTWDNTAYEMCSKFNGQKYVCTDNPVCNWQPSGMFFDVLV